MSIQQHQQLSTFKYPSKPGDTAEVTPERKPMPQRILLKDDPLHLKANN